MQTQTGFSDPHAVSQLSLFICPTSGSEPSIEQPVEQVKAPCRTSEKLMEVLEEITGWKSEFAESSASYRNRTQAGMENEPAQGTFSIVDMSADWPANQFTAHRGKCDQLVGLFSDLVAELQSAKLELSKVRSAIAALPSEASAVQDEEVLIDSFVPKFGRIKTANVPFGSDVNTGMGSVADCDDEFEVLQELGDGQGKLVPPPFDGWCLGGTTGIVEDTYLDWLIDSHERIAISAGKIESAFGDGDLQAVLKVEPLTSEFRVAAQGEISAFYHWDAAVSQIKKLEPSPTWTRIGAGDAIIASTDFNLNLESALASLESLVHPTADTIAETISSQIGCANRTLVLQRGNS